MVEGKNGRSGRLWRRIVIIEVVVGIAGLILGLGLGLALALDPEGVARSFPQVGGFLTLWMQATIGVFSAVIGTYTNYCVTMGRSPLATSDARGFAIVAGASQVLTVALSIAAQYAGHALTATLAASLTSGAVLGGASAQLTRGVQIWVGAALAYIRNLPQVWVFSWAVPGQQEQPSSRREGWFTRSLFVRPMVVVMTFIGIAGSVVGLIGYPVALHIGLLRTFILSSMLGSLLEWIQGTTGGGQGWSGALFNHHLRNRKRRQKLSTFSWEFARSCGLGMVVTAASSVGLQLITDRITGATNPLAVAGIAALMSAIIATIRGGLIAPLVFGLVGANSGAGLKAIGADVGKLVRVLIRRR